MNIRPKTVRRLLIIFLVFGSIIGGGAALYVRNAHARATRLAKARATGLAAFKSGDYEKTISALSAYPRRDKSDVEAMFAFATARARVELPGDEHNKQAIQEYKQLLSVDPTNLPSRYALLAIYKYWGFNGEMVSTADEILAAHPDDVAALKYKAYALERNRKLEPALAISMRLNELEPENIDQQLATFQLMKRLKRHPLEILKRAQTLHAAHENDSRFELMLAIAYGYSGDDEQGKVWLRKAANRPAPDADFVRHIAGVFDALKMFEESQAVLDRAVSQNPDPQIMRVLVQRLWQSGQAEQAAKRLEKLDPADPKTDSDLLAFRALSLCELDKVAEARPIITALGQRKNDPQAAAWAAALSARFGENQLDPKSAIVKYQAALARDPDNAVIRFMIGEAYARLGENELAVTSWTRSTELVPSWARPHVLIARTYAGSGRIADALEEAQLAVQCAPNDLTALSTLATVRYDKIKQRGTDAEFADLMKFVEQIQKTWPGDSGTLPIYVSLLARTGQREIAVTAITTALSREKPYEQSILLRLLAASRANNLGQEPAIMQAAAKEKDPSPALALAQATDLASRGKPNDGLALMQKHTAAATQPAQLAWKLALAEFREETNDPAAAPEWITLGDAYPEDIAVQRAILAGGNSARADREFVGRTIERLKKLTGDEGTAWKLERARWLISSEGKQKDSAEAVNLLTDIIHESPKLIEARKLLAAALQQLDNIGGATTAMQGAAELAPQDSSISLELAALLQQQAKFMEARAYLDRAAKAQDLTPDSRRRLAALLAQQGDAAKAALVLEAVDKNQLDDNGTILLASIYRRLGRMSDAQALFASATTRRMLSAEMLQAAAEFYASQKRMDQASALLAKLPEVQTRPGVRELITANFEERFGDKEAALKQYVAATRAADTDAQTWRQLAGFYLRTAKYDAAVEALDGGIKSLPNNAELKALRGAAVSIAAANFAGTNPRPLIDVLVTNPTYTPAVETLQIFSDAKMKNLPPDEIISKLGAVIKRFPRFTPAHAAIVQIQLSRGNVNEAMNAAEAALMVSAGEAEPARIATEVARIAKKFDRMASAAQKWRERTMDDPMPADLALAEAKLALHNEPAALALVTPYVASTTADADRNMANIATIARVLAAGGKEADARAMLEPLAKSSKTWRVIWLIVAAENVTPRESASAWIEKATPMVTPDDKDEQFALASAWQTVAQRFSYPPASAKASEILKPLCERADASADAIAMLASIAQAAGDLKAAEAGYRRALKLNENLPGASNNLAYILLSQGRDLPEARKLAEKAVEVAPREAAHHDTLARIAARTGDTAQALKSFQTALNIQPDNLEAMIGMASTLAGMGKKQNASNLLPEIDRLMKTRPALSEDLRRELELVRSSAKASL